MTDGVQLPNVDRGRGSLLELAIVFGLTVALPLCVSALTGHFFNNDFGQQRLLRTVAAEIVAVILVGPWLAARGWSFRALAGTPAPIDIWRGFLLAVLAYVVYFVTAIAWLMFVPGIGGLLRGFHPVGSASGWVVMLVVVVNPVVEELLWLGYGFNALRRYGTRAAVVVSIALRVSLHLYQGWMAVFAILPVAIVFTVYFAEKKRLWPVVVAHMLVDSVGLIVINHR